jgi:hypothetical protein
MKKKKYLKFHKLKDLLIMASNFRIRNFFRKIYLKKNIEAFEAFGKITTEIN